MTEQPDAHAEWTRWLALDEVAVPMATAIDESLDGLGDQLLHLRELGLAQFGQDAQGDLWFRVRTDHAASVLALLDDDMCARRN